MYSASKEGYKDALLEALLDFRCNKDLDVQDFLNNKAITFELRGWASTYLCLSQEALSHGVISIEGYFSLTHKAVVFDDDVSLSARKKIAGTKGAETESFVLIGQLGKRISDEATSPVNLTAHDLLSDAMMIISASSDYIVARNVLIECKPIPKVKEIYQKFGFTDLQYDEQNGLHTLYLRTENQVIF